MPEQRTSSDLLTIGELSRRSGLATSALRFYEERGLIHSQRNSSGHRRYQRAISRRVAFISFAQRVGYSLEEIRVELNRLPKDHVPTGADWQRLTELWEQRIAQRIQELERLKNSLSGCIGCGCLSLKYCKILNHDDHVASQGPGPRFWIED